MIDRLAKGIADGRPVYIDQVRDAFDALSDRVRIGYRLLLPDGVRHRSGELSIPSPSNVDGSIRDLAERYLLSEIYNLLTTLGGYRLELIVPPGEPDAEQIVRSVAAAFGIDAANDQRTGVARVVNVIDRMVAALHGRSGTAHRFAIDVSVDDVPPHHESVSFRSEPSDALSSTAARSTGTWCGLDIGGTDIKAVLVVDGELVLVKEHDWNPARMTEVEQIIDPIVDIVRIFAAYASVRASQSEDGDRVRALRLIVDGVADRATDPARLADAASSAERLSDGASRVFDGIGLCFPDVVVRNKIVGGEVPKMVGLRSNRARAFEEQFATLTDLDDRLARYCTNGGVVANTNDGPMAAFTAAVELAAMPDRAGGAGASAHGVFAHSLGTDLGTGLVLGDGSIPEIPLEVYNLVIDLGSLPYRNLPANDVRSVANTNTGVTGTLQRYASQTGAFRTAQLTFPVECPALMDDIVDRGYVSTTGTGDDERIVVPESPHDMRKAYLAFLMEQAEHQECAAEVFRQVGEAIGRTWVETERILETTLNARFLFGRLVKTTRCFELIKEGARRVAPMLELIAADGDIAYTPLMRQLDELPDFTVAQFGQAVGAVHFAMLAAAR